MFAYGVAGDTRHLADLHMRMLPSLGQFNCQLQALGFTE
jgi:hypothetical protein